MEVFISDNADYETVSAALSNCSNGSIACCQSSDVFNLAKTALVKERIQDVTVQLLDQDHYVIRQVTSKKRNPQKRVDRFNDRQIAVIQALEKVIQHCRKEGIQLIGYSDELVAIPAGTPIEEISSACAIDIDGYQVYQGADNLISSSD